MNAREFNNALAEKLDITQDEAATLIETMTDIFRKSFGKEGSITFQNFGSFSTKKVEPRKGYSPILKKYVLFPPKRVLEFSPSEKLKDEVKSINLK